MADGVDHGVVDEQPVRPLLLGLVHRHVGAAKEFLGRRIGGVGHCDADAGADRHRPTVEHKGIADEADQPPTQIAGDLYGTRAADHDRELVAADARQEVAARAIPKALRHLLQQLVAGFVTEGVIDFLEPIEVEIDHRDRGAVGSPGGRCIVERRDERRAVRQAAQFVVGRRVAGLGFAALDLAHPAERDRNQEGHGKSDQRQHHEDGGADLGMRLAAE